MVKFIKSSKEKAKALIYSCSLALFMSLSLYLLHSHPEYINSTVLLLQFFMISTYVFISINISFILYRLLSCQQKALFVLFDLHRKRHISTLNVKLLFINLLSIANIGCLFVVEMLTPDLQAFVLSLSLSAWASIVWLLLSIDHYIDQYYSLGDQHGSKGLHHFR